MFKLKKILSCIFACSSLFIFSCKKVSNIDLPPPTAEKKVTVYKIPLRNLGRLSRQIPSVPKKYSVPGIQDDTGTSMHSGGEIQNDITEMLKSSLNQIGGVVSTISYDPSYVSNMGAVSAGGISQTIPDYILEGGITEFDRSLESGGSSFNFGGEGTLQGNSYGGDISSQDKNSTSNITLDLNLANGRNMMMIPRMSAVNSIKVYKGSSSFEVGIQILSASLGYSDSIKKIQGRHAAIRLLVELGVLELVGKSLVLPYWKCLPDGQPDEQFLETLEDFYTYDWPNEERIFHVKRLLIAYGFDNIIVNDSSFGTPEISAIKKIAKAYNFPITQYDGKLFINLFKNVPVLGEKNKLHEKTVVVQEASTVTSEVEAPKVVESSSSSQKKQDTTPFKIQLSSPKTSFKEGEEIKLSFKGNKNFYGRLVVSLSNGQLVQLLPNAINTTSFFYANKNYAIPGKEDKYTLTVSPPFGTEKFILYASEKPLGKISMNTIENGLLFFDKNISKFEKQLEHSIRKEIHIKTTP